MQKGRVVWITGGGSGIGLAGGIELARAGAHVVISGRSAETLKKWRDAIYERPAVKKAFTVLAERRRPVPEMTKEQKENLFGAAQYAKR